jgi:hypothetical protein
LPQIDVVAELHQRRATDKLPEIFPGARMGTRGGVYLELGPPEPREHGVQRYTLPAGASSYSPVVRIQMRDAGVDRSLDDTAKTSYVCALTSEIGGRLKAFRRSRSTDPPDWHPAWHFSGLSLVVVGLGWDETQFRQRIMTWRLTVTGTTVLLTPRLLMNHQQAMPAGLPFPPYVAPPPALQQWAQAIRCLQTRWACRKQQCEESHFGY